MNKGEMVVDQSTKKGKRSRAYFQTGLIIATLFIFSVVVVVAIEYYLPIS